MKSPRFGAGGCSVIRVENLHVQVGTFMLDSISFEVAAGQYAVLMGRTGAGKTTLMETICGLRPVDRGRIWLPDREVTALKPAERGIGFVPQDGALFETMAVREQLGFALTVRRRKHRGNRAAASRNWPSCWESGTCSLANRPDSAAESGNGWRWAGRWPPIRVFCAWTNP